MARGFVSLEAKKFVEIGLVTVLSALPSLGEARGEFNGDSVKMRDPGAIYSARISPLKDHVKHRLGFAVGAGAFNALNERAVRVSTAAGYREEVAPGGWVAIRWSVVGHTQQEFETGLMYWKVNRLNVAQNLGTTEQIYQSSEFIALPIVAKMNWGDSYASGLSARIGVAPSALLSASSTRIVDKIETQADIKDALNSWDIFAVAGISTNFPMGESYDCNFGLEYVRGLRPINGPNDPSAFHQALLATLGLNLDL